MLFLVRSQQVLWHRYRGLNNSPLVITPINLYTSYGLSTGTPFSFTAYASKQGCPWKTMRCGYTRLRKLWSSATSRVYHDPKRCMTRAMNPWIRMSFEIIRPGLASWSTPTVTLDRPPPVHHHHRHPLIHHNHSRPRRRIRLVLPLS